MGSVREKKEESRKAQRCLNLEHLRGWGCHSLRREQQLCGSRKSASEGEFAMPHPSGDVAWVLRHAGEYGREVQAGGTNVSCQRSEY